jgi:hypothetical protein
VLFVLRRRGGDVKVVGVNFDVGIIIIMESMLRLYIALARSKPEYASVVWNSIASTDASKPERIQQRFAALCFYQVMGVFIRLRNVNIVGY